MSSTICAKQMLVTVLMFLLCTAGGLVTTRAEAAEARGADESPLAGESVFTDVGPDDPYYEAIYGLWDLGIVTGYSLGLDQYEFRPWAEVARAQFAKMVVNSLGIPVSEDDVATFVDVQPEPGEDPLYPDNYIAAAAKHQIIRGYSATNFGPWDPITRAQAVTLIVRALVGWSNGDLEDPSDAYQTEGIFADFDDPDHGRNMQLAEYNGLLNGLLFDDDGRWDPWRPANRAEVAQLLHNCLLIL